MSERQYRDKIVDLTKKSATARTALSKANAAAAKHRSDAAKERAKITAKTSESSARGYVRNAESATKRAGAEDKKAHAAAKRLGDIERDLATAHDNLEREQRATAGRTESKRKAELRAHDQADGRRRTTELAHARQVARLSRPTVRVVHEVRELPAARREKLRILYLTADASRTLRVDVETRNVQNALRGAAHRDNIDIQFRPAATPHDLIDGLNDVRPHVVHFSGHTDAGQLAFDNADVTSPQDRPVSYNLIAKALRASSTPPVLVILNACDTMEGAETLLDVVGAVIATTSSVSDPAAALFAARFYAGIAAAQPVGKALEQALVAIAMDPGVSQEQDNYSLLIREGIDLAQVLLVQSLPAAAS